MKKYGIYLLYRPGIDLRAEGLGRHLANFLKASNELEDVQFVIACPSWMKPTLVGLMDEVGLSIDNFEIISAREDQAFMGKILNMYWITLLRIIRLLPHPALKRIFIFDYYAKLQEYAGHVLNKLIAKRRDILSWYCPTLFWPCVNQLKSPVLICAPDVVPDHFPINFAILNPQSYNQYLELLNTIQHGKYFTTYSQDVKKNTLAARYQIDLNNIFVIPHGANRLDAQIDMTDQAQSLALLGPEYADMKFIFYASQIRPNKNILTLLKAYEYLRRNSHIKFRLMLTGNPNELRVVVNFIEEHKLKNDIIWLHGISTQKLAACYHMAELSVNPTFSEGGFPFTFTESLSVGTPVVLSRINVVEEVIVDPELNELMLFDPYDWKSMADKIEWALNNKDFLLSKQMPLYNQLAQRTWTHVVSDYVEVLDKISQQGTVA